MSKKLLVLIPLVLLLGAPSFAAVGIFTNNQDVGAPKGIGSVVDQGYVWKTDHLAQQYLFTANGHDIWDASDDFHFAYRTITGDVRVTASYDWVAADNDWAKTAVMLRATTAGNSVHYSTAGRKGGNYADDYGGMQYRPSTGSGSSDIGAWKPAGTPGPIAIGVQRITVAGMPFVESFVDWEGDKDAAGNPVGWVRTGLQIAWNLPDTLLAGVAVTSHNPNHLAQSLVYDVKYETKPTFIAPLVFPKVPEAAAKDKPCTDIPGFSIRTLKAQFTTGWGRAEMNKLLDFGCTGPMCTGKGMPIPGLEEGKRVDPVVNLHDTAGRGVFGDDSSFPGIDPFQKPTADPAAGDDDNNFATEVLACIKLTKGLHIFGVNDDDGTILEVGGVEIGRSTEWKGTSTTDFIFEVAKEGWYSFRARHLEGGGGAALELHEVLAGGKRILLGDVAAGGSPVVVPEPATIALLGLGGLALLGIRKRS